MYQTNYTTSRIFNKEFIDSEVLQGSQPQSFGTASPAPLRLPLKAPVLPSLCALDWSPHMPSCGPHSGPPIQLPPPPTRPTQWSLFFLWKIKNIK